MNFLAAIPVIGQLFDSVGNAIDKNITSDHERLKMKAELTQLYSPLIQSVIEAQKAAAEMQVRLADIESKSEHWLVWARRPTVSLLAVTNFMVVTWLWLLNMPTISVAFTASDIPAVVEFAFYFAMTANGLDITSRGVEKVVKSFKTKESI